MSDQESKNWCDCGDSTNNKPICDTCKMLDDMQIRDRLMEIVKNLENPYPKDIFTWDNKDKLDFNRGRFHQFCFEIVETIRKKLLEEMIA
jgi:hypothetical protein